MLTGNCRDHVDR